MSCPGYHQIPAQLTQPQPCWSPEPLFPTAPVQVTGPAPHLQASVHTHAAARTAAHDYNGAHGDRGHRGWRRRWWRRRLTTRFLDFLLLQEKCTHPHPCLQPQGAGKLGSSLVPEHGVIYGFRVTQRALSSTPVTGGPHMKGQSNSPGLQLPQAHSRALVSRGCPGWQKPGWVCRDQGTGHRLSPPPGRCHLLRPRCRQHRSQAAPCFPLPPAGPLAQALSTSGPAQLSPRLPPTPSLCSPGGALTAQPPDTSILSPAKPSGCTQPALPCRRWA